MKNFLYKPGDKVSLVWCRKQDGSGGTIIMPVYDGQEKYYLLSCDFPGCEIEHLISEYSLEKIDGPASNSEKEVPEAMLRILESRRKLFYVEPKKQTIDTAFLEKWK